MANRIIVENYFGRLVQLWKVKSCRYRWSEGTYDTVSRLCYALTNRYPLRSVDGKRLEIYRRSLFNNGVARKEKKRKQQIESRLKRTQGINQVYKRCNSAALSAHRLFGDSGLAEHEVDYSIETETDEGESIDDFISKH